MAIDPETYNKVIQSLKPLQITLVECSFAGSPTAEGDHTIEAYATKAIQEASEGDQTYVASQHVQFFVRNSEMSAVASGACKFVVQLQIAEPPPEGFWGIFLPRNMPLYLNPAVRDLVASMCMRANISAKTLPSVPVIPNMFPEPPAKPEQ